MGTVRGEYFPKVSNAGVIVWVGIVGGWGGCPGTIIYMQAYQKMDKIVAISVITRTRQLGHFAVESLQAFP